MARVALPTDTLPDDDEGVVVLEPENAPAVLYSGDATGDLVVEIWLASREDYQALTAAFMRHARWRAMNSNDYGTPVHHIDVTLAGLDRTVKVRWQGDVTRATPAETLRRDLWGVTYRAVVRWPDLQLEPVGEGLGLMSIREQLTTDLEGTRDPFDLELERRLAVDALWITHETPREQLTTQQGDRLGFNLPPGTKVTLQYQIITQGDDRLVTHTPDNLLTQPITGPLLA